MSIFKPFKHPEFFDYWKQSEQMHWLPYEVPLNEDIKDWNLRLSPGETTFLTHLFRFFTQGDLDVASAYARTYIPESVDPEIRMMLLSFGAREALHVAAYSHLIESLGMPETIYNEFSKYAEMKEKHAFADYILELEEPLLTMAVFSGFIEGMQLFSSFAMLLNFTRFGKLRGMGQIIQWSIADESLHTEAMIKLFRLQAKGYMNDERKESIYSAAETMVKHEDAFIDLAFGITEMEGLTKEEVKGYIRYIADRRLISMGLKGIFKVKKNPLPWVEELVNAVGHTNFFENRAVDYGKGTLTGNWNEVWKA